MKNIKDNPGVFVPPPLFYVLFFLVSFFLQGYFTIKRAFFFHSQIANILGLIFIFTGFFFAVPAVRQFFKSKTSIVPIRPASSLQTTGIYSISRNPMYLGLFFQYLGMALIFGNWWTLFLIPVLIALIHFLVIRPEERYLSRAFGDSYSEYRKKVRRWI
jgi:protein-S-isoprenylcysteine O-methyltransferase Ste14